MGAEGPVVSSTPSGDVDILEGQDQETVVGSGAHLDGVVVQTSPTVNKSCYLSMVTGHDR